MHFNEDHFLPEIINPETGEVLPEGSKGELVITTLSKEAIPVLRYRSKDITSITYEKCECGRTHARMSKPSGRSDDMLIIRGVNVFQSQIVSVLVKNPSVHPHYHINVDRVNNLDTLEILVELSPEAFSDKVADVEAIRSKLAAEMASGISVSAKITLVSPGTIERSEGKAKRITDLRKK